MFNQEALHYLFAKPSCLHKILARLSAYSFKMAFRLETKSCTKGVATLIKVLVLAIDSAGQG